MNSQLGSNYFVRVETRVYIRELSESEQAYDSADYGKTIYAEKPDPSLSPADAAWSQQFVPTSVA